MRFVTGALLLLFALLEGGAPALAQSQAAAPPSAPAPGREFEIQAPPPASRDATRPRESDFYPEDIRTRHEPAFIKPLTTTVGGRKIGVSGWTAPPGRGDSTVQREVTGWFSLGITVILDSPDPPAGSAPPRR